MSGSHQISVVITCFDREELIGFAITSAISEFPDAHIIVVDDFSSDASRERICSDFRNEMKQGQLKLIQRHVNGGVTAAKNTGFRFARSTWVLFLDSDDIFIAGCRDAVIQTLTASETYPAVFFRCFDHLDKPVGGAIIQAQEVNLTDFLIHGSKGEVLTAINKPLIAPTLPYFGSLRGYEGLGICRILERYGVALNSPVFARIYHRNTAGNLSAPLNVIRRARLLSFGHRMLIKRYSGQMPQKTLLAYRLKALIYGAISSINLSFQSGHATRFSKPTD